MVNRIQAVQLHSAPITEINPQFNLGECTNVLMASSPALFTLSQGVMNKPNKWHLLIVDLSSPKGLNVNDGMVLSRNCYLNATLLWII